MEFIEKYKIPLPQPELVFGFLIGPLFIYREDHFILQIIGLVVAASIVAPLLVMSGCRISQCLKESKLYRLQVFAIVLAVTGVALVNLTTDHCWRIMAEIKEFFIALSFLLFGVLYMREINMKGEPSR